MPDRRPTVSCVIPTHNRSGFLAAALKSVIAQTYDRLVEIVVVDDTSAAETRALVERLDASTPGIDLVYLAREGRPGASASRNAGARAASGDWIAFLDDDDLWLPEHVESLVAALGPDDRFAVSWMIVQRRDGSRGPHYSIPTGLRHLDALGENPGMTGSNVLVQRELFLGIDGFDEQLPVSNDKDMLVRLLAASPAYAVSPLRSAVHRQHVLGQLTNWDESRAAAMLVYLRKYDAVLSGSQRRYLMRQIYSIRRRGNPSPLKRAAYTALFVAHASPRYLLTKASQRA